MTGLKKTNRIQKEFYLPRSVSLIVIGFAAFLKCACPTYLGLRQGLKHGQDLEQNYRLRQHCEKEQRGKNRKDTYGGQEGDSLNDSEKKKNTKQELEMVGEGQMIRDVKPMLQAVISNILFRLDTTVTLLII